MRLFALSLAFFRLLETIVRRELGIICNGLERGAVCGFVTTHP